MTDRNNASGKDKKSFVPRDKIDSYLKYSGMAFELLGVLLLAAVLGQFLDRWLDTPKPYCTAASVLFFFSGYVVRLFYQTSRNSNGRDKNN